MKNHLLGCMYRIRPGRIFPLPSRDTPGLFIISSQAFVWARNQCSSGSPLYFVLGGSATILSDAEMHSVRKELCNFESGRDAEVDARGKIIFGAVYRHTPGKDFSPFSEICARTDQNFGIIKNFHSGYYHITRMALYYR